MATIRKRNGLWQVQVRRKSSPQVSKSFRSKSDADAWARQMEVEADRGFLRNDPRVLEGITLGQCVERYRDEVSQQKRGHDVEKWILNAFLRKPLAKRNLASITPKDFAEYRDDRLRTISPSGLNRELVILHHLYETAKIEWGYPLTENPLSLIRKPRNNPPRERRLRDGEYERLLAAAEKCRNKFIKPIIILAVETAMRRGEILAIRRKDIDLANGRLRIPLTKTGVARTIPLSPLATDTLAKLIPDGSDGNDRVIPLRANALRLCWDRLKLRGEIADLHFHDLRHEAVSRLFEQGLGVAHVAAISGHRDFRMLGRYTHLQVMIENT
ncbi:MAG: tyrosine-type recombinase/integrase [Pseudomonadota bacterium]